MAKLIWVTGLAGSGKTTIAEKVFKAYKQHKPNTVLLDGDVFREIMGHRSGHSREERFEVAMQIARLCKFLVGQGIDVICATISLFREVHQYNRENFKDYVEIFVDCDMDELIRRDKKGLYSRAIKGEISNVVGVDIPFDKPENCILCLVNNKADQLEKNVDLILNQIL